MKIKVLILSVLFVVQTAALIYAEHIPVMDAFTAHYESRFTIIGNRMGFNPYAEFNIRFNNTDINPEYMHILLGSYYRIHKNIKIGGFYKFQTGARHDDDWVFLNPGWEWADSSKRFESLFIFDITPRFNIPVVLMNNTITSVKMRYQYNFFNNQQTLLLKPGLGFFKIKNRNPVWNGTLAYSVYIPLNFSEAFIYQHGLYLNFIYHLNRLVKFELRASLYNRTWTTGADSIALGDSYRVTEKGLQAGIGVIITP